MRTYGVTAFGLDQEVERQLASAARGTPLVSIGAELHPPDMLQRPNNVKGAHYRVAYWLAVGARPSRSGGAANGALLYEARQAAARARAIGPTLFASPFAGDENRQIDQIIYQGEQAALSQGRRDIAGLLNSARGSATSALGPLARIYGTAGQRTAILAGVSTVWVPLALITGVGVLLWLGRPYIQTVRDFRQ